MYAEKLCNICLLSMSFIIVCGNHMRTSSGLEIVPLIPTYISYIAALVSFSYSFTRVFRDTWFKTQTVWR